MQMRARKGERVRDAKRAMCKLPFTVPRKQYVTCIRKRSRTRLHVCLSRVTPSHLLAEGDSGTSLRLLLPYL